MRLTLTLQQMTRNKCFSLIELLVVFSILLILVSLLSPSLKSMLLGATDLQCTSNLREWGLMHSQHEEDNDGLTIHLSMHTPNDSKKRMNWPQYINYYVTGSRNKYHGLSWCPLEESPDGRMYGMNQKLGTYTVGSPDAIRSHQYLHPHRTVRMVDTYYWFFRGNIDTSRHDRISLRHRFNTNALWLDGHASLEYAEDLVSDPDHFNIR